MHEHFLLRFSIIFTVSALFSYSFLHQPGLNLPPFLAIVLQVISKQLKGGKESKMDVLVMENLLYRRNITRLYDLKGSLRSRYNPDSSGNNKVLLDENLMEAMPTSPIFVGNKAKRLLERAVWNDTAFLAVSPQNNCIPQEVYRLPHMHNPMYPLVLYFGIDGITCFSNKTEMTELTLHSKSSIEIDLPVHKPFQGRWK